MIKNMYKMKIISLLISLFGIIKTKALECVSVVNQKCMPRPKILDVNEGVGEALFYPYNVQVSKCSGSCNTLDNPMAKLCIPNVIKGVNMQVYNFFMRLNETRNVLWHERCKYVCKLNSSVCNNKYGKIGIVISVTQYLHHNLGYKKYKLFDVTKFILVLPTFRLKQQSLSRTRC